MTETKLCETCLEVKPIDEFHFRYRKNSTRRKACGSCHNKYVRQRRAQRRKGERHEKINKFVLKAKRAATDKELSFVVGKAIDQFGGVVQFVETWFEQWQAARRDKPGSKKACDGFYAVMRLMQAQDSTQKTATDFDLLSTEDLEREAERLLAKIKAD